MATKKIAWQTGSGNITLTYQGQGDGTITVESDPNDLATARSKTITIKTTKGGLKTKNLTITQGACPVPVGTVLNYAYTGSYQEVTLPAGRYKLQVWGAQGGSNAAASSYDITAKAGGKGGYSEGVITLSAVTKVRVYVGGAGSSSAGGFNGGGSTTGSSTYNASNEQGVSRMGGGGGATDIRLSDGALLSRMIVAGGGSGGAMCYRQVISSQDITDLTSTPTFGSYKIGDVGTSQSLWSNSDKTTGNNWGYFGFKFGSNGNRYVTHITIDAVTSCSDNTVAIFTAPGTIKSTSSLKSSVSVGLGTYELTTPLKVSSGEMILFDGAGFKWKSSGGDVDTYTEGGRDGTRIYSFNFTVDSVVRSWGDGFTSLQKGQTYYIRGTEGIDDWYVKFAYGNDVFSSASHQWHNVTSFTVPNDAAPYFYIFSEDISVNNTLEICHTEETTTTSNISQVGYIGGGTNGGGYNSSYYGKQNSAGRRGLFGQGANQTIVNYRYCSGAGGAGWYGGGSNYSDSDMDACKMSGGGSGFVNTVASAGNRPSGYTGLQLDSGTTYAGNQSFPAVNGGSETGHAGNGYARITRIA